MFSHKVLFSLITFSLVTIVYTDIVLAEDRLLGRGIENILVQDDMILTIKSNDDFYGYKRSFSRSIIDDSTFIPLEPEQPTIKPCSSGCGDTSYVPSATSKECPTPVLNDYSFSIHPALSDFQKKFGRLLNAVAVVEIDKVPSASAFYVKDDLIITNFHVVKAIATPIGENLYKVTKQVRLLFGLDKKKLPVSIRNVPQGTVILVTENTDLAIFHVARSISDYFFELASDTELNNIGIDEYSIVMAGFAPVRGFDPERSIALYQSCGDEEIKQTLAVQIGRMQEGYQNIPYRINYTFNTFGGNSGSPIINVDSGHVIGVHVQERTGTNLPNSGVKSNEVQKLIDRFYSLNLVTRL